MKTTCMDLENSKTCGSYNSLIKISDKINYKWGDKYAPTSNEKSELLERSYSILEIQDYFKYVIKKMKQYLIIQK